MAVEMLTTDDPPRAREIALLLDGFNRRRQDVERQIFDEAQEMLKAEGGLGDRRAIVLGREGWHAGVIGIVAGRMAESFHRPTVIISLGDEISQGSARSIPGFDLYEALKDCSDGLIAFGGHAAAAGLKLTADQLPAFARRFEERCRISLSLEQLERVLDDRRRDSTRCLEPGGRHRDRNDGAPRDLQSPATAPGDGPRCRGRAPSRG